MLNEDHLLPGALGEELCLPGELGEELYLPGELGEELCLPGAPGPVSAQTLLAELPAEEPPQPWVELEATARDEPETVSFAEAEAVLERITRPAPTRPAPRRSVPVARPFTATHGGRRRAWPWGAAALLACAGAAWFAQVAPQDPATPTTTRVQGTPDLDRAQHMLERVRFSERRALGS